jgi:hypothetical protein
MLLQGGFVVAECGTRAHFAGELVGGFTHNVLADEGADGGEIAMRAAVKEECANDSFHSVREHGAFAAQAAAVFPFAEADM